MAYKSATEKEVLSLLREDKFESALNLMDSEFVSKKSPSEVCWFGSFVENHAPILILRDIVDNHPALLFQFDKEGNDPLYFSAKSHRADALKLLRFNGIDIYRDINGFGNCMHVAARFDNPIFLKSLVKMGFDYNEKNQRGETPLDVASRWGNFKNMTFLDELQNNPSLHDDLVINPSRKTKTNSQNFSL